MGQIVAWTADPGPLNHEHLASIEETLPESVMDYHGLEDAALRAGLSLGGRTSYVSSSVRWLETKPSELSGGGT